MPSAEAGIPADRLRQAVAKRVQTTSLRRVADAVGMSPSGLQKFLNGAEPYSATRHKLESWYVRHEGIDIPIETASRALELLVADAAPTTQMKMIKDLIAALEGAYRKHGTEVPGWLETLKERQGGT